MSNVKLTQIELNRLSFTSLFHLYSLLKKLDVFLQLPSLHLPRLTFSLVLDVASRFFDQIILILYLFGEGVIELC